MELSFQNISFLFLAGAALVAGVISLRFLFKFAWKIIRVGLILLAVILAAGYFLGFLDIIIR